MADIKQFPLFLIEWVDAESDVTWEDHDRIAEWGKKECLVTEIGFVIYEDENQIVITNQLTSDKQRGNRTKIPKALIKKRQKIKVQFVRKK